MANKTIIKTASSVFETLQVLYPQSPRTRIKKLLQHGQVVCNGKVVTLHSFKLVPGDTLEIKTNTVSQKKEVIPFPVLYNDEHVIVIDKPAGIASSDTDIEPNVYSILSNYIKKQSNGSKKAFLVHRIDRDVSGVLLFAKSNEVKDMLQAQWDKSTKLYQALVEGRPNKSEGSIKSWLVEDKNYVVHSSQIKSEKAKYSITHYRTIEQFDKHTLLEIDLETGRKNQIRVHMADLACSIVGDIKYGAAKGFGNRVRLHAVSIKFPHPITKEIITICSPLPKGFLVI